jgi:hypothetical protein
MDSMTGRTFANGNVHILKVAGFADKTTLRVWDGIMAIAYKQIDANIYINMTLLSG